MTSQSPQISIIICTRTGATEFGGVLNILEAFKKTLHDPATLEVIIRGDVDDTGLDKTIAEVRRRQYPYSINFIKGNRGRGYEDTHHFQNEGWLLSSAHKKLIFSLPEDVILPVKHWDKLLLNAYDAMAQKLGHTIFTIHQVPDPGLCDNYEETLENPDPFPMYTADWMSAVGGFSLMTCNDAWVQAAHHYLLKDYGMDCKHVLNITLFQRNQVASDGIMDPRWINARLRNHDLMRSKLIKRVIQRQSESLYTLACEQMEKNQERDDVSTMYETLNMASDRYGTASVLFKVFYALVLAAPKELIKTLQADVDEISARLQLLKDKNLVANIETGVSEKHIGIFRLLRIYVRNVIIRPIYRKLFQPLLINLKSKKA